ncbi:PREDICTED: uncharacterized protein LOC105456771 [Wasmannia auropunctata]|uniref:uncharacterized protein LOC105456771 n=1 Tax=Wasmannia auropunctata TaxID=64793 RepID=UPI0005EE9C53|nr:PREDICTED: uncharacterized protein LOC105456771 [Wasmannia auropunctata]
MLKGSQEETIRQINEAQMELKIRLEQVSRLRIDCGRLQLELLKLYKPRCLGILEMLRDVSAPADGRSFDRNGDAIESCNDQGNEVLRTSEDVSRKSATSGQDQIIAADHRESAPVFMEKLLELNIKTH